MIPADRARTAPEARPEAARRLPIRARRAPHIVEGERVVALLRELQAGATAGGEALSYAAGTLDALGPARALSPEAPLASEEIRAGGVLLTLEPPRGEVAAAFEWRCCPHHPDRDLVWWSFRAAAEDAAGLGARFADLGRRHGVALPDPG